MVEADSHKARVPTARSLVQMSRAWPKPPVPLGSGPAWARLPLPALPVPLWNCASPAWDPTSPYTSDTGLS